MWQLRAVATGLAFWLGLLLASGCMPVPPNDDNGDISFARQAPQILLGRKAKGHDEVQLLRDLTVLLGREAVVRLLMEQPEFTSHWTDTIIDDLRMQRDGDRRQSPACFGDALRSNVSPALADFVTASAPSVVAPGGAFNMADLIASAIAADDLSAVLRAYPIPLAARAPFGNDQQPAFGDWRRVQPRHA